MLNNCTSLNTGIFLRPPHGSFISKKNYTVKIKLMHYTLSPHFQKHSPKVYCKRDALKISHNSQENNCAAESLF